MNDAGCNLTEYTDTRLEELLVVAAHLNLTQVGFSTIYTITISTDSISPDPSTDAAFINFMVLRAACLADEGLFRNKALAAGIEARCGPAVLKTVKHLEGFTTLLEEGPCKLFDELLNQYRFSGNSDVIRAVLSPFVGNLFNASMHARGGDGSQRDRITI